MKRAFKQPYIWWTLFIFFAYLLANVLLSNFTTTLISIPYYLDTINWSLLLGSLFLSITIAALVSVNMVYAYIKYHEHKQLKNVTAACSASVAGLIIGVCPLCTASILPLLLGAFGITFAWTMLPFNGVEIQIALIILLSINLGVLRR